MKTEFQNLPIVVQDLVKKELSMFKRCFVTFEYGKYHVSSSLCLASRYADDRKFIGTFLPLDVFTKEEHLIAQILSFGYSPTYNVYFYPNKECWSDDAIKYSHVREQFMKNEIQNYINMFGHEPSKDWIDRH